MKQSVPIVVALAIFAFLQQCAAAADSPAELVIGKWNHRKETTNPRPDDSKMEFSKDGTGQISETKQGQVASAKISWKVTKTIGNAGIVVVDYVGPKPQGVQPMTWLIAFDGNDAFVMQGSTNRIDFWDRQK